MMVFARAANDARWSEGYVRIMDRRVVPAQRVDLLGDSPHLGEARQVADNDILGLERRVSAARASLRACSVTRWPSPTRSRAAIRPRPSDEPVMKMRDIGVPF
jgi:hypothetical protein